MSAFNGMGAMIGTITRKRSRRIVLKKSLQERVRRLRYDKMIIVCDINGLTVLFRYILPQRSRWEGRCEHSVKEGTPAAAKVYESNLRKIKDSAYHRIDIGL